MSLESYIPSFHSMPSSYLLVAPPSFPIHSLYLIALSNSQHSSQSTHSHPDFSYLSPSQLLSYFSYSSISIPKFSHENPIPPLSSQDHT